MSSSSLHTIRTINSKISNGLDQISGYFVVVLGLLMTGVVLLGVFYRYVLVDPIAWTEELSTFSMVWLVLIGGGMGIKRSSHVGVTVLLDNFLFFKKHRKVIQLITSLLITAFLILLIKESINISYFAKRQTSTALGISMFWPYLGLVVGGILMLIQMISKIIESITGETEIFKDECSLGNY